MTTCAGLIAIWWKRKGRKLPRAANSSGAKSADEVPLDKLKPRSLIAHLLQHSEPCREFVASQCDLYRRKIIEQPDNSQLHATLGSLLAAINRYDNSIKAFERAISVAKAQEDQVAIAECEHELCRVRQQSQAKEKLESFKASLISSPRKRKRADTGATSSVDCRHKLSYKDFFANYACKQRPVLLKGVQIAPEPWTLPYLRARVGMKRVTLKRHSPFSTNWARLDPVANPGCTMAKYIDRVMAGSCADYLHDWSLPIHCPDLVRQLTIPRYFSGDLLQKVDKSLMYTQTWPSLFIGPEGTHSALHVDGFGSNFWMFLFSGRKRWVFFERADMYLLSPRWVPGSLDPIFDVDLAHPDHQRFPMLRHARRREVVMSPGDLLFVPSGCPHFVQNLETSVAISCNYIDGSNLHLARRALGMQGLVSDRARQLLRALPTTLPACPHSDPKDMSWSEFKGGACDRKTDVDEKNSPGTGASAGQSISANNVAPKARELTAKHTPSSPTPSSPPPSLLKAQIMALLVKRGPAKTA